MNRLFLAPLAAALAVALSVPAAGQPAHDHSSMMQKAAEPAKSAVADGEVRRIDRAKGTVTMKHGALDGLNMPPMTMAFVAKDPKMLANVKEGDKVRFTAEQGKDGTLVVTRIEVLK
jgi:Cu/Ag efflux protein CusF